MSIYSPRVKGLIYLYYENEDFYVLSDTLCNFSMDYNHDRVAGKLNFYVNKTVKGLSKPVELALKVIKGDNLAAYELAQEVLKDDQTANNSLEQLAGRLGVIE